MTFRRYLDSIVLPINFVRVILTWLAFERFQVFRFISTALNGRTIEALGRVARSMASANHWLRSIKTYTFLW